MHLMRKVPALPKKSMVLAIATLTALVILYESVQELVATETSVDIDINLVKSYYVEHKNNIITSVLKKKDYHNYTQIEQESQTEGIGEQGKPAYLSKDQEQLEIELSKRYGYNALLSDTIPLNRSLPDMRNPGCKKRLYLESLPTVSIIIPIYNERWSTILRTVYSALNRSPENLIKEVILIDDGSAKDYVEKELDDYIEKHMPKVNLIRLAKHSGLVTARLAGAEIASGDVLMFMDAHTEAHVNWLPPLLEPIMIDYRTVVEPVVNDINRHTLEHNIGDDSARGVFDWCLTYSRIRVLPKDEHYMPEPFETPVMMGGMFAISRRFFWELGGYDPNLRGWGGEQFELSFKIWMCGGQLLQAPCSRFGHIYRDIQFIDHGTYIFKNFRRVVEVWMDEYAKYYYLKRPEDKNIYPGDLTKQMALREKLKCKPFKWFMTQVAFDLLQQYPPNETPPYAEGRIRPSSNLHLCVDTNYGKCKDRIVLKNCTEQKTPIDDAQKEQLFELSWFNDILAKPRYLCWESQNWGIGANVTLFTCHHSGGNQMWKYDQETKQLLYSGVKTFLTCLAYNTETLDIFVDICDFSSETQRWEIDTIYEKQMAKWNISHSLRVTAPVEKWKDED